jgi:tRNA(Ile)-lysidine synthase
MVFGAERLAQALAALDPAWQSGAFCVALSGGVDSVALLHAMHALQAAGAPFELRALHVDHGLQAQSPDWAGHCRALCERLAVPFEVAKLQLGAEPAGNLEARAREARYAAIAGRLRPGEWLLTAHHRDDQLETVLIQLMRGAGVAGLAAMPGCAPLGQGRHGRPLLGVDRAEIAAYAEAHALEFQRDPMNESPRFDRGWLRSAVLPPLRARWPAAAATVARSAAHLAGAGRLLTELAASDARTIADGRKLRLGDLGALSRDRQANLLRWWLRQRGLRPPPAARLAAALEQLLSARADAQPSVRWRDGEIRRYRGRLYALRPLPGLPACAIAGSDGDAGIDLGEGGGRFRLVPGTTGGIRAGLAAPLSIRFRGGGESLRPQQGRPRKRLKDLCQEAGIVPWMRPRLPLVFSGATLVAVADLWIDSDFRALPGRPALMPVWDGRPELY